MRICLGEPATIKKSDFNQTSNLLCLKPTSVIEPSNRKPNLPEISDGFVFSFSPGFHRQSSVRILQQSADGVWCPDQRVGCWFWPHEGWACQDLSLQNPRLLFEHHRLISSGGSGLRWTLRELVFHFNEIIQDLKCRFFGSGWAAGGDNSVWKPPAGLIRISEMKRWKW